MFSESFASRKWPVTLKIKINFFRQYLVDSDKRSDAFIGIKFFS
jgi:hypothetical protein